MSTLNVANITDGVDTVGTGYVVNGSAKAWGVYRSNSIQVLYDSLNCSSLVDNGTGNHNFNFASSFSVSNDVCMTGSSNWRGIVCVEAWSETTQQLYTTDPASNTLSDRGRVGVSFFGDLA